MEGQGVAPLATAGWALLARWWSKASKSALEPAALDDHTSGNGGVRRRERTVGGNGKGATAAVTRCGCHREVLRGVEVASRGTCLRARETRRTPRSAAGCDKPATPERRKPSRWCETTRTERDCGGWLLRTEARGSPRAGVDARKARRWRGSLDESHERRPVTARATGECSAGERKTTRVRARYSGSFGNGGEAARHRRKTSKTRRFGKVKEGAGKADDPLRRCRGRQGRIGNAAIPRQALKVT
jgi:hypothetical protein